MYTQDKTNRPFFENLGKCDESQRGGFGKFKQHFGGDHPFKEMFARKVSSHKPVNIIENENDFTLNLYAAGLNKNSFKINVKDQVLSISYTDESNATEDKNMIYQELYPTSFERKFQLTEKVLEDQISASYESGVLTLVLLKNPEKNKPEQTVTVN